MNEAKRILALDVGERRIGVAVSDPLGITAQSVDTINRKSLNADIQAIADFLARYDTDRLLLGLPSTLSGEEGMQARVTREFAEHLTSRGWEVRFFDERMTTAMARGALIESGMRREKRKQYIDRVAAVLILQSFLDSGGWKAVPYRYTGSEVFRIMDDKYDGNMDFDGIVELVDEEGKNVRFEFLMMLEHEGGNYLLLTPAEEIDGVDEDEVIILKVDTDENGEDVYVSVDDEKLMETLFEKYLTMVENEEDDGE